MRMHPARPVDDDRGNGIRIVVEYAGAKSKPACHKPPPFKWDYRRFAYRRRHMQTPEIIRLPFANGERRICPLRSDRVQHADFSIHAENARTSSITDGAATWNQRFVGEDYVFGREPNEYARAHACELARHGCALCVADGEGRNSVWLASEGLQVEAFDIAEVGVAKARKLAADAGVSIAFHVAGCDQWPWAADAYDAVVAVSVQFADPAMRGRLFTHMVRALKPGGVLILQGYTPKQLDYTTGGPGVPFASDLYTAELLREAFASLQTIELVEYAAELSEGLRHAGRSALIGFVARKP